MKPTPAQLAAAVLAMPAAIAPEVSRGSEDLFRGLHEIPPRGDICRDLAYGDHPRHLLDLHLPSSSVAGAKRAVLVFVHGGGFARGDKSVPGEFFYDNVGAWAARNGMVGAVMTYRLAPDYGWPSGAQDVAAAVEWLRGHADAYDIDPALIFVMGHSAGAAHVAGYLAGHGGATPTAATLGGAILVSGTYDLVNGSANKAYFGEDAAQYAARSSLDGVARSDVPLLVAVAQADPPVTHKQFAGVLQAVLAQGKPLPHLLYADGHNHYTIVHHLGTDDRCVGDRLVQFIANRAITRETPSS